MIDGEEDNHMEEIDFADLVKYAKSVAGFSPSANSDRMMPHKYGLPAKTV